MMKNIFFYILLLGLLYAFPAFSQVVPITTLKEVVLSDIKLHRYSKGQWVSVLSDSTLTQNEASLTSVLKFNTPVYFKENGYGMVASPSFRGTTASQTAVLWNGININSQFNGQTDFNAVTTGNYDNISVRGGGGSVVYGSGAIGGTVHLNNRFEFNKKFTNGLRLEYGSFNTFSGQYKAGAASEETSIQISVARNSSDNNFRYLGTEKFNENGEFYNTGISAGIAHILDKKNSIKFHSNFYEGERAFSGTLTAPSRSKYKNLNSRNLLEWKAVYSRITSSLKLAYLDENFKYYENRNRDDFSFGKAKTGIAIYDLNYNINKDISINGILDFKHTNGQGTNLGNNDRSISALAILFNHDLGKFNYDVSARKEITSSYESPLLFSLSAGYAVTNFYGLKFNLSKNFRIPTYNDLFWGSGGNPELKPEESHQVEIGQSVHFKNFEFELTAYLIQINNLLRWTPDTNGLWRPENTQKVRNRGIEGILSWQNNYGEHQFSFNSTYAYTRTRDEILKKELIYVPKHKATASLGYSHRQVSFFYQFLYNGDIFTSSDNNYTLNGYSVSNAGSNFHFGKKRQYKLGVEIRNIFNAKYQSLPSRPMPGRSINSSLTFKF